jgi:hypothetical protein
MPVLDLTIPEHAYMFGFFQTDGHLYLQSGNKGKFTLELSKRDEHILYEFQKLIPCYSSVIPRTRDTNFKKDYDSTTLCVSDLEYRTLLNSLGIPYGKKPDLQKPPIVPYSEINFIRGIVDANGSVGYDKDNYPFMSFTTYSDPMADYFKAFITKHTGQVKEVTRNKRDNIYNINVYKEDAVTLASILYPLNCLSLKRKYISAQEVIKWLRPDNMRTKYRSKPWTNEQDEFIKTHTIEESVQLLNRNKNSIEMRLWRLKKCSK